jgi:zinc transporter, ZIP family
MFTAFAIAIHNFPEGMAVFFSALSDQSLGIVIASTIALHNIPEGMAVAAPIYFATKSKKKAFSLSFLSGLAEPAGAVIGYLLLKPFLTPLLFSGILAGVAGIMVYISLDELLPTAEEYGEHHLAISGLIIGMGVMAISLLMLS